MKKEETIKRIEAILSGVGEEWLADDGGLTMAAGDLISFGKAVIDHIQANDAAWCWNLNPFDADTGDEGDIISLALAWARGKLRRQIEDRLRKDFKFFERVVKIHLS